MPDFAESQPVKIITALLAVVATGLAGLLLYQSQTLEALPGCGGGSGCETVLTSEWSSWLGVPVSLAAMGVYVVMLCSVVMRDPYTRRPQPAAEWGMLFSAMTVLIAAIWFLIVQVVIIHSFCIYCMSTHLTASAAAVLCLLAVRPTQWLKGTATAGGAAVGLVAVLIVGQVLGPEPEGPAPTVQYVGAPIGDPTAEAKPSALFENPIDTDVSASHASTETTTATTTTDDSANTIAPTRPKSEPRKLSFYGGRFTVDTTDVPILGDPNAPKVLVILFDYACSHCRVTRGLLEEVRRLYGDKLAIVCLPVPLCSKCNRLVKQTSRASRYACELAEASLAVWRVAPEKWAEFDKQLYTEDQVRTPGRARAAAIALIGSKKRYDEGLSDPWVDKRIASDVDIFEMAGKASGSTLVPMLFTDQAIMNGQPRHPLDVVDLINGKRGVNH